MSGEGRDDTEALAEEARMEHAHFTGCSEADEHYHPDAVAALLAAAEAAGAIKALREAADAADRRASGVREDTGDWLRTRASDAARALALVAPK